MSIGLRELRDYRTICAEIDERLKKLSRDKRHVVDSVQTAADFPFWKHTIPIEGDVYPYPVAPERRKIDILREKKAKIERFVGEIEDYKIQRMIVIFYIEPVDGDKITWEDVADRMADGSTGDSCRMRVKRFFEK